MTLRAVVPLVTVVAGLAAWAVHTHAQPPEPLAAPQSAQPAGRLVGVGGCAAAGCHNAPKSAGASGTEYAAWVHDPHGRAFATADRRPTRRSSTASKAPPTPRPCA